MFTYYIKSVLGSAYFWSIMLFATVVLIVTFGVVDVSDNVTLQQRDLLESAVRRGAVQCYALEGSYPMDLEYLINNYDIFYEESDYVIHYTNIGGNLLPEIAVFYIGGDGEPIE